MTRVTAARIGLLVNPTAGKHRGSRSAPGWPTSSGRRT